jgi:hypothetical protein
MKTCLLALTMCIFSALTAQAQWVGGYASYWDTEDFGEAYGIGAVGQWQVHELFALEARGAWYFDFGDPDGEEIEPASLGVGPAVTIALNEKWTAYGSVIGSIFAYARDVVVDGEEVVDDDGAAFGFSVNGGLRTQLQSDWSLFAEAHYNVLTVDTKNVRDGEIVDDEIVMDGFGINLGIGRTW